jgi:protein TonB
MPVPREMPNIDGVSAGGARALRDPLDAVLALDSRHVRTGAVIGLLSALSLHAAGAARAYASPIEIQRWASAKAAEVHDYLWTTYDIEVDKPKAQPEQPKPEEQPQKEAFAPPPPAPVEHHQAKVAEKAEPPPAAAQAGKVLTQEPDPDQPVDLTGQGFVTGNADSYAGGVTASNGTSKSAVYDKNARPDGVVGAKGAAPVQAAAPAGPDLSRPAKPAESSWASCAFPPEADADQIDFQVVTIVVTVRADGTPQSVRVLGDPGHGFGRAARQCALGKRFVPALDHDGNAILAPTPPFTVRFQR